MNTIILTETELAGTSAGDDSLANAYANQANQALQADAQLTLMTISQPENPSTWIALAGALGATAGSALGFWGVTAYDAIF